MMTYVCKVCGKTFVPKDDVDFNNTSGFRTSSTGSFRIVGGVAVDGPQKVKCTKCGSKEVEMTTPV